MTFLLSVNSSNVIDLIDIQGAKGSKCLRLVRDRAQTICKKSESEGTNGKILFLKTKLGCGHAIAM